MRPKAVSVIILLISVFLFSSCDRQMVYDHFVSIENSSWEWDEQIDFSFDISDTTQLHNIYVRLRHTTEYPLSNLYMFVSIAGPSDQSIRDTINFILAENSGKWIGSGISDIREIGYLYRKNIKFPEAGAYKVSLEQAMRLPAVPVKQVGLRIERVH